jgi:hypothetical protein
MPFSKHRRKPGGKSVRHPERRKLGTQPLEMLADTPEKARWRRFAEGYTVPFHAKRDGEPLDASRLLEIIAAEAFETFDPATDEALWLVSKVEAFRLFTDCEEPGHEVEDAEAALRFLEQEGMVEVEGGDIRVPACFWPIEIV